MHIENWDQIKKRLLLLWNNEILDRPVVSVTAPKHSAASPVPAAPVSLEQYYLDPECILQRNLTAMENTYYAGDAYPVIFPFWGCGGHSKYLQTPEQFASHTEYAPDTIWMYPVIDDYDTFDLTFHKENPQLQRELEILRFLVRESKGRYFVAPPDNCGSYDALANLRGSKELIMDFIDRPEDVKRAGNKLVDALIAGSTEIFQVLSENNDGGSVHGWYNTWSPGKHLQLQCDLSVMISPAMFEEFIMEELKRTSSWLDHAVYHMDGMEQLRFLDMLLSIKTIHMIQWVQVDGQPDITHNFQHIQKIQASGKGVDISIHKSLLDTVLNNVSPYGLNLRVHGADTPGEADEIVKYVAAHSFHRTLY